VLFDNASKDPLVSQVIRAFDRRGMFAEVRLCGENDPNRVQKIFDEYQSKLDRFFYFCENDVMVPAHPCWASVYANIFDSHPNVGMVGSLCEPDDFVSESDVRREMPNISQSECRYYCRTDSYGERDFSVTLDREIGSADFPNPPGRLLLLATEAVARCGVRTDHALANKMESEGFSWYITQKFRHRHLSLMSFYDYPNNSEAMPIDYRRARNSFFRKVDNITFIKRASNRILGLLRERGIP